MKFEMVTASNDKFFDVFSAFIGKVCSENKCIVSADVSIGIYGNSKKIISLGVFLSEKTGCSVGLGTRKTLNGLSEFLSNETEKFKMQKIILSSEAFSELNKVTLVVNPV